jgi:hypothetical protein
MSSAAKVIEIIVYNLRLFAFYEAVLCKKRKLLYPFVQHIPHAIWQMVAVTSVQNDTFIAISVMTAFIWAIAMINSALFDLS